MRTSSAVHSPHLFFPPKITCMSFGRRSFYKPAKYVRFRGKLAESGLDKRSKSKKAAATLLIAEKEEAKAVLILFLKQIGLSNTDAVRIIKRSDLFLDHLVSKLRVLHKTRYMTGRELTTMEIREALNPYLEALFRLHGDSFIDMIVYFPEPPPEVESSLQTLSLNLDPPPEVESSLQTLSPNLDPDQEKLPKSVTDSLRPKAMARVSETVPGEELPPHVIYLIELGLDLEKIRVMTSKFPPFAYCSLEGKVKPLVEFLLELGVPASEIPKVLYKRPQLCGISLSENLIPTMKYYEQLGFDKQKWSKAIVRFPTMLIYSREKIDSTVSFLTEMGLSKETIGKVLTSCPHIVSYSVEYKLWPAAEYFRSMGVDVTDIVQGWPQALTLSIEDNLKPMTEFFLEKGYSIEEIAMMIRRSGSLYTFSLSKNVLPKWEFFLTTGYPRSELVKFPPYFGYSLEGRIKPRYALMELAGVRLSLNQLLTLSDTAFDKALKARKSKMETSDC